MIKNFKDLGYFDDADNCIYMYREKFFNRIDPCDWLSRIIQYGVKLRNPFILILLSSTFLILMRYKYETGDLHIVLAELILIGIFLPILVVVLARKLIR